jgi:hypothetical protein
MFFFLLFGHLGFFKRFGDGQFRRHGKYRLFAVRGVGRNQRPFADGFARGVVQPQFFLARQYAPEPCRILRRPFLRHDIDGRTQAQHREHKTVSSHKMFYFRQRKRLFL